MTAQLQIVSVAPSIGGASVETDDYQIVMARVGDDGPLGYSLRNKHTEVLEYVARSYVEAHDALHSFQNAINRLKDENRPKPQLVQ